MKPQIEKRYDVVLLGADQQLGGLVVECITKSMGSGLNWAIAGSKVQDLNTLMETLIASFPDRKVPSTISCSNTTGDITALVRKAKVVISLLGPSHEEEITLEACAKNGVHCVVPTSHIGWLAMMIKKFHDIAKRNDAMIVVGLGAEIAPKDLLTLIAVLELKTKLKLSTKEVLLSQPTSKYSSPEEPKENKDPWSLSPIQGWQISNGTNVFGARKELTLGHISSSKKHCAQAIVHRSWGLSNRGAGSAYGERFCFYDFVETSSSKSNITTKLFGSFRSTHRRNFVSRKVLLTDILMRAVAIADQDGPYPDRALAECSYTGTSGQLTAILLAQSAATILYKEGLKRDTGGGILTPAMLGMSFIERLRETGIELESHLV